MQKQHELRKTEETWKLRAARRAEATAIALAVEAEKLENVLAAAGVGSPTNSSSGRSPGNYSSKSTLLPEISPNGSRLSASNSTSVLETNAALQKLARETLAVSQTGSS